MHICSANAWDHLRCYLFLTACLYLTDSIAIFRAQTCRENPTSVSVKNQQLMDLTWVNPIEVLQQWIKECSHIQFCWFCRHCSSYSQETLPLFHVTVSDGTWLFSMSSCVHVNSLLDCAESFSSLVFFWVWGATQGIAIPDYIWWWKKLVHFFFYEIVPEIFFLSSVGSCVTRGYGQMYFSSFLIGTFWSLLSPIEGHYARATILFFWHWTEWIKIWAGILKW